jgi:hypothetical protein
MRSAPPCFAFAFAALAATALAGASAHAQEPPPPSPWFPPPPANAPYVVTPPGSVTPNVVTTPDGGVTVTRTPQQGVDVHAQTESGTVHAWGCSKVTVDPSTAAPAPAAAPAPYGAPPPCPAYYMPYPAYPYAPYYQPFQPPPKPRYAPDAGRTGALIASSILFGLGTAAAGTGYLLSTVPGGCPVMDGNSCQASPSTPALLAMGAFLTLPPSMPRFVVGDVGMGLLYTGLRGASFAAGAFIPWKDNTYVLPVTFAFVVPMTLGIIDLATTPHREQVEAKDHPAAVAKITLTGLAPTVTLDKAGNLAPTIGATGTFF